MGPREKKHIRDILAQIASERPLGALAELEARLDDVLDGPRESLLSDTLNLLNDLFFMIDEEPPKSLAQLSSASLKITSDKHPKVCETLWDITRMTLLSRSADSTLQATIRERTPREAPVGEREASLKRELIKSLSDVSALSAALSAATREREALELELDRSEAKLEGVTIENDMLRAQIDHLRSELSTAGKAASAYLPFDQRCDNLRGAARLIAEAVAVSPPLAPLHELSLFRPLDGDPHAERAEVISQGRPARLRYVIYREEVVGSLTEALWSMESSNTSELSGISHPSLARLITSAPPSRPGYSVWGEPAGRRLSELAGATSLKLCDVVKITSGLIIALRALSAYRVQAMMPRLDMMVYESKSETLCLTEPCAVSDSSLNPPELTLDFAPKLYTLSRAELEAAWVYGASELIRRLVLPAAYATHSVTTAEGRRAIKLSLKKSAKRAAVPYSSAWVDSLTEGIVRCLSDSPRERFSLSEFLGCLEAT